MDLGVEGRKVAIEIIATLVHIKSTMAELLLKPAGVPVDVYRPLFSRRDEATGRVLTKRQMAPFILAAMDSRSSGTQVVRGLVEIAAGWTSFHLAEDEYAARATCQKAREILGTLQIMAAREAEVREIARREEVAKLNTERAEQLRKHSGILLMAFDQLAGSIDAQARGFSLQDLLNRTFDLHSIPVVKSFTRNDGAEQIDGAFKLDGWHYIVECRWRKKLADIRELDGLKGQIDRSGRQTMGLFLSINGWSENVPALLKQNPEKAILLMEGHAFRSILAGPLDLADYLMGALARLNLETEPYLPIARYLEDQV